MHRELNYWTLVSRTLLASVSQSSNNAILKQRNPQTTQSSMTLISRNRHHTHTHTKLTVSMRDEMSFSNTSYCSKELETIALDHQTADGIRFIDSHNDAKCQGIR